VSTPAFTEVTELAGQQALFRELIRSAFAARLGDVTPDYDFHRGWNGGWRCRATLPGKAPLDFALLHVGDGALLALPVPMPRGWIQRGVRDSAGRAWTVDESDIPVRIESTDDDFRIIRTDNTPSVTDIG
jgi:hypothetical protein